MKGKEVEFKYDASSISLESFHTFCKNREKSRFIIVSGYDRFFTKQGDHTSFFRHRRNLSENELTFKRKTVTENNYVRVEHNMTIGLDMTNDAVESLVKELQYHYDATIFKNCFIYNFEYYTLVYYVCYDENMTEKGRFVEIEMKEDHPWANESEAFHELTVLEKLCNGLGLSKSKRVNKSLYELFKKEVA